ncbi:NADAR family protein [Dokdonia sp.]|uniref:NADAR family protein n=1 Tax=Dokdonia sp. TaxID=2024995 RepID=UPI0032633549
MKYTIDTIKNAYESQKEILKYVFFWGHTPSKNGTTTKSCFSQWWTLDFEVGGTMYKTAEHWMMAEKARLFSDNEILEKIIKASHPNQVKKLGRKVSGFDPEIWDAHKYEIVKEGNYHKFSQHKNLKEFLINTGDRVLVEASPFDPVWGIGLDQNKPNVEDPNTWKGENLLGFALMEVRDRLLKNDN